MQIRLMIIVQKAQWVLIERAIRQVVKIAPWPTSYLVCHVGVSESAIALSIPGKVKAQAAQAFFGQCFCHLWQHKAVLMSSQAMAQNGNILCTIDA